MTDPAYVRIANEYAQKIREKLLPPGVKLPTHAEIAEEQGVSDIVVRRALRLLESQGLVRARRRSGIFVADRPGLVRVSPERQMEGPEQTFRSESEEDIKVERREAEVPATAALAEEFGIGEGDALIHTVTQVFEGKRPVSVSDTFALFGQPDISEATTLEETLADRVPTPSHADALQIPSGEVVKTVKQRFRGADERLMMLSDVSYRRDRYDAFVFKMNL